MGYVQAPAKTRESDSRQLRGQTGASAVDLRVWRSSKGFEFCSGVLLASRVGSGLHSFPARHLLAKRCTSFQKGVDGLNFPVQAAFEGRDTNWDLGIFKFISPLP